MPLREGNEQARMNQISVTRPAPSPDSGFDDGFDGPVAPMAPIVARLNAACAAVLHAPDMQDRLGTLAITPTVQPPEAWPAYLAAESAKWREVIRARNIRVT